jgi:hypothetical protein
MARNKKKPIAKRSVKSGKKTTKRINKNLSVLKNILNVS